LVAGAFTYWQAGDWTRGLNAAYGLRDPEPSNPAAIARGRVNFQERCVTCHGQRGRGDGPGGVTLDPRPADLVLHVPQHTDGELYYMISRGMPNSAMPAWSATLSERARWDLVHYLRALGDGSP
jgi:putative copper resistance protein D